MTIKTMATRAISGSAARVAGSAILSALTVATVVFAADPPAGAATAHTMHIDVTAVSVTQYYLDAAAPNGWPDTRFDNTAVQTASLPEGSYKFLVGSGQFMSCDFTVTASGTWSYDPSCGGFVTGTGTDTLTVTGYPITLDPSALSEVRLDFAEFFANAHLGSAPKTFELVPTRVDYLMLPGSGEVSSCGFGVGLDGNVTLSPASQPCLSGAGTDTVVFHGFAVQVDARQLSTGGFVVNSFSPIFASSAIQTLTLLPLGSGSYEFEAVKGQLSYFFWNVDSAGNVSFPAADDSFASGRGTPDLLLSGLNVNVDATNLGPGMFDVKQLIGPDFSQSSVQVLRLVPGGYWFVSGPGGSVSLFTWTFGLDGLVGYTGSPAPCVTGRSTTTLVVGCVTTLSETTNLAQGGAPFTVTFTYAETSLGYDPISNVSVTGSICGTATLQSGDTNGNGLLDRGETWLLTCTHTFTSPGTYTDTATATGTNTVTNQPSPVENASATVQAVTASAPSSMGYWKTHHGATSALLPQTLGSFTVGSLAAASAIFNAANCSASSSQSAVGCLAGQLLSAELNVADNASNACIASALQQANALLVTIGYTGPSGQYALTSGQRQAAISLATTLANYNTGTC